MGGFTKVPDAESLAGPKKKILNILDSAEKLVELFTSFDIWPEAVTSNHMMCIQPKNDDIAYPMWGSRVHFDGPGSFDVDQYRDFIHEKVLPDYPAKIGFLMPDNAVKTGAFARLFYYSKRLNPHAQKAFSASRSNFGNPFHNNIAQAVEILQYLEDAGLL